MYLQHIVRTTPKVKKKLLCTPNVKLALLTKVPQAIGSHVLDKPLYILFFVEAKELHKRQIPTTHTQPHRHTDTEKHNIFCTLS